ncbi:hypothetical protein E3Q22_01303 [Wallemia mellicola]|uniref:Uncharacterized protein n=1 Tax=Wallemia mellicola TaxID=1708541 RepID=A0A4T0MDR9_9BASI|nr:hypothetical protein E3Q22_01303 [Wallemia mellicola]
MISNLNTSLLRATGKSTLTLTKSFTRTPTNTQWKSLSPSSEPDFSLFEPTDYEPVSSNPAVDNKAPCTVLRDMTRKQQFIAAREILSDLRQMNVPIRQSQVYTIAAIERLLDNDIEGATAWLPLIPQRAFHASHILHIFFANDPTNLDALVLLARKLPLSANQATHVLAHLVRFSQDTLKVVKFLEDQETKSQVWNNQRDVFLNQLALTKRFDDLDNVLKRWCTKYSSPSQTQETRKMYIPSAFTSILILQESIKNNANERLLRQAQWILSNYHSEEAKRMAHAPSLGPKSASREIEENLLEEISQTRPNDKVVKRLLQELFADSSFPSAKVISSLVTYYQTKIHTIKIAPRLAELRDYLLNRQHLRQRAKSLWTFSRMIMQLHNSIYAPDHKRDMKAKRVLEIFSDVYLPIGIPDNLISKPSNGFDNILNTYKSKSHPLLLWPDPFVLGVAYTSLLIIHKNDKVLHNRLWRNLISPATTTSNDFIFTIPPSMRPDSLTCLPFLHIFSTKHNPDRVREALEDMANCGIPFAMEGILTLLRAYASRNRLNSVRQILNWLQHQESEFNIPRWDPPENVSVEALIPHLVDVSPLNSQTRAFLERLLQKDVESESGGDFN